MRALIERRLARAASAPDPLARLLADAAGPITPALRERLASPQREAAVLVTLIDRPLGWTVLFTERARHLANHPGQISFPGGRLDDGVESAVAAALREAWEEVRLPPETVSVAGTLPNHVTGTGFIVTPVVGFVSGGFEPIADPAEVAAVFEVPLAVVLAPGAIRLTYHDRLGTRFKVYELDYDGRRIWGATASMLKTFRDIIADESE